MRKLLIVVVFISIAYQSECGKSIKPCRDSRRSDESSQSVESEESWERYSSNGHGCVYSNEHEHSDESDVDRCGCDSGQYGSASKHGGHSKYQKDGDWEHSAGCEGHHVGHSWACGGYCGTVTWWTFRSSRV
jgi:hypothetical protein